MTITDQEICSLRDAMLSSGRLDAVNICSVALGLDPCCRAEPKLTQEQARKRCEAALAFPQIAPGTLVGAEYRRPYPLWNEIGPHCGTVLDPQDPRAWAGTIAFPESFPNALAVRLHVQWCHLRSVFASIPVAWSFGRIYFEDPGDLRPYAEEVAAFAAARAAAIAQNDRLWAAKRLQGAAAP